MNELMTTKNARSAASMGRCSRTLRGPLSGLALLLLSLPSILLAAAQEDKKLLDTFEDRTGVFEVQVPVNVSARSGEPIRDLKVEDFEVFDEGQLQEIIAMRVVDLETLSPDSRRVIDATYDIPAAARRYFLFLFDMSFSSPTALVRAREAAQQFVLNEMHPSDLAAVAVHSVESGTQLLVTFTPDRVQLARAITTMGNPRLLKLAVRDPLSFLIEAPDISGVQAAVDSGGVNSDVSRMEESVSAYLRVIGKQMARVEKSFARGKISQWSDSMRNMARILASIEGRKHVVLFSEGFDGRLLFGRQPDVFDAEMQRENQAIEDGQYWMVDYDDRFGNTQLQGDMSVMLAEFKRANVTIQAVNISGLRADLRDESNVRKVGKDALFYLANETGGRLYEDANDFGPELKKVLASSSLTYLLSFKPSDIGEPGEHRQLRVRVKDTRGTNVSHRLGYYVPKPFAELHPMEKKFLASGPIATATPISDFGMEILAAPFKANDEQAYVPVIVEVDGKGLLRNHESDQLPVEIYTYVSNADGEMKDFFTQLVTLDMTSRRELFSKTGLKYYGHVELAPGDYLVRVLVRNGLTGATSVQSTPVHVPQYSDSPMQLLPPFFIEDPGSWFLVREQGESDEYRDTTIYPFTVRGEPYIPSVVPKVRQGEVAKVCMVAYNYGNDELDIQTRIVDGDGLEVAGGHMAVEERTVTGIDGLDKLYASFDSTGLAVGDYTLEIEARYAGSDEIQRGSLSLTVLD